MESPPFFLGCASGAIHYADDMGHCSEEIRLGSPILEVLVIEASDTLVVVNEDLVMSQYTFTPEGKLQEVMAVSIEKCLFFQYTHIINTLCIHISALVQTECYHWVSKKNDSNQMGWTGNLGCVFRGESYTNLGSS